MTDQMIETKNSKVKLLFITGFIFVLICASVYLFVTALDDTARIDNSDFNNQTQPVRTDKFH